MNILCNIIIVTIVPRVCKKVATVYLKLIFCFFKQKICFKTTFTLAALIALQNWFISAILRN